MKKTKELVKHYMSLPYDIEIHQIPKAKGGGYSASIPLLGRYAFLADGETVEEAARNLEEVKKDLFQHYLDKGIRVPEPRQEEGYSGQFVVRIPRNLHAELVGGARQNNISLNQYIGYLLTRNSLADEFSSKLKTLVDCMEEIQGAMDIDVRVGGQQLDDQEAEEARAPYREQCLKLVAGGSGG